MLEQVFTVAIVTSAQGLYAVLAGFGFQLFSVLERLGSQLLLLLFSCVDALLSVVLKLFLLGPEFTHDESPKIVDAWFENLHRYSRQTDADF